MKTKEILKRFILDLILCVFIGIFLICGYSIYVWAEDNRQTENILEDLKNITGETSEPDDSDIVLPFTSSNVDSSEPETESEVDSGTVSSEEATSSAAEKKAEPWTVTKDINALKQYNSDTKGWIKVAGLSKLDYPFVQCDSDEYYLDYNFYKKRSSAGWVFADNDVNFVKWNPNSMFYGHSRKDGSMFGSLHNCFYSGWYNNPNKHFVYLTTETDELIFQVFSVYHTNIYSGYNYQHFYSEKDYQKYLDKIIHDNEIPQCDYGATTEDVIITLTTCNGGVGTPLRVALHAKLVYSKKDPSLESYRLVWPEPSDTSDTPTPIYAPTSSDVSSDTTSDVSSDTSDTSDDNTASP